MNAISIANGTVTGGRRAVHRAMLRICHHDPFAFTGRWLLINGMAHRVWRTCRGLNRSWSEPLKGRRRK